MAVGAPSGTLVRTRPSRRRLELGHHIADSIEPCLPEHFGMDVHPKVFEESFRRAGPSRSQQLQVSGNKGVALDLVQAIEGQDEEIAETIGVAIEGAREDVRDRKPFPSKLVRYGNPPAKLRAKVGQIHPAHVIFRAALPDDPKRFSLEFHEIS